jgi:hypothetical protein
VGPREPHRGLLFFLFLASYYGGDVGPSSVRFGPKVVEVGVTPVFQVLSPEFIFLFVRRKDIVFSRGVFSLPPILLTHV